MSPSYLFLCVFILGVISTVYGDVYLQNPKGCNDRLDEETADREQATRLFNSENNARGGYCWGPELTYYEGSILSVEWTNQHSCGNGNTHCNLVLQYMCSDEKGDPTLIIRDGKLRTPIQNTLTPNNPTDPNGYNAKNTNGDFLYGMNEPLYNFLSCAKRTRNKGLFLADQTGNMNEGAGAMATRQDPNGQTYGFECTEERDYFPYWHPSPWKDIAVLADKKSQCGYYQSESQNVKEKYFCNGTTAAQMAANRKDDCVTAQGQWVYQAPWKIGKPDCKPAPWSRDNHLGNGMGVHTNSYNWTLPRSGQEPCIKNGNCSCVLRLRYNITVGEMTGNENALNNDKNSPIKNNPTVSVNEMNYTLAINTQQTGRTFQDRSYMFRIAPRPPRVPGDATIFNLNVRGKRGNIVQTYPATEYDFVPTFLEVHQGDYIHFQWTGCDHNPAGNDGNGRTQTDRSNIVQIKDMSRNLPLNATELQHTNLLFKDPVLRARMSNIDQVDCLSYDQLQAIADNGGSAVKENLQNCMLLNAASPRFTGALVKMNDIGTYSYMNTRNNNFSNRSQKGQITVKSNWAPWKTAVVVIGGVAAIGIGAAAATVFYAHRHPLSKVAEVVHRVPGLSRV